MTARFGHWYWVAQQTGGRSIWYQSSVAIGAVLFALATVMVTREAIQKWRNH